VPITDQLEFKKREKEKKIERGTFVIASDSFLLPLPRAPRPNPRASLSLNISFFFSLHSWPQAPNSIDFSQPSSEFLTFNLPHPQTNP